uniref:Ribonuclease 3-like protein 3 n=1 Tax=Anthurium amnicola TaxID=1678845 RepID=A0A1D1XPC4_9ARAE
MGAQQEEEDMGGQEGGGEEENVDAVTAVEGDAAAVPPPPPAFEDAEFEEIEGILGYQFEDRTLVVEALTHNSFYLWRKPGEVGGLSYERLEFVGDAVLNCVVARELHASYLDLPPGPLTRLRAANVDTEKLARVAVGSHLHRFLRHNISNLDGQIEDFAQAMLDYPIHSNGLIDAPKVLADIVESLLGAIFVDSRSNLETVWKVYKRLSAPMISPKTLGRHPVSELLELCQKRGLSLRFLKDTWSENTTVGVMVDGKLVGCAAYGQKKEIAQNRAAKAALDYLKLVVDGGDSAGAPGL